MARRIHKKPGDQQAKLAAKFDNARAVAAGWLVWLVFVVQPLAIGPRTYQNITFVKYYTYAVIIYIIALAFIAIFVEQSVRLPSRRGPEGFRDVLAAIRPYEWALIAFWAVMLISAVLSENPYAAFIQSPAGYRSESFIYMTYYLFSVAVIGRFYRPHHRDFLLFCAVAALVCFYGICQYYGADFLSLSSSPNSGAYIGPNITFISTMSNRNMLSTYLCMAFCVSAVMFSRYKPSNENLFGKFPDKLAPGVYLITGWIIFYMMILGQTESGYVALLVSFVLLFPFVATCRRSAARLIFMFSGCLFWIWASAGIHHNLKDWEHLPNIWRPFGPGLIFLAVLLAVLALGLAFIPKLPKINRWVFRSAWYALIVAAAIAIVIAIPQLAAISGHKTIHAASEILQGNFDDTLGGHRIFIWRRAITLVPERPLFGHGPDNFAIVFMERFVEDAEGITYDKAHNEYIQQLVDNGILGLSALLAFYGLSLWKLRKKLQNPVSLALLLAMTAFMVQAFFNFSTPFAHPMVWALWGMVCAAGIRGGENPENTG